MKLDMDEMDLTAAESKETYEKSRDYVLEHSGLNVNNLYIAQVKRKCGIIDLNSIKSEGFIWKFEYIERKLYKRGNIIKG